MNKALYADVLKRIVLLDFAEKASGTKIKICVHRNHAFEMVASVLNAFLQESGLCADFKYSDYDDSFNFQHFDADVHILWIDVNRYKTDNLVEFIKERVKTLRSHTIKPILIIYTGEEIAELKDITTDAYALSVNELLSDVNVKIYDENKESISGTRLSGSACLYLSRIIGLKYIPALLKTPFKAIVVDLDNTLYKGILGEDGIENLIPNNNLQAELKKLKQSGLFLCIASKNEESDVKEMFDRKSDFFLKWDDFTLTKINWESKNDNLLEIAKTLNIGTDAILFIDDNPAEIQNVEPSGVKTLLAQDDIANIMKFMPGLLKLKHSHEDVLRAKDIQANAEREKLAQTLTPAEYFKKLGIKLEYNINNNQQIPRVAELLGKTNQFILNYVRYNETQVLDAMSSPKSCVITIGMSDNLSDSGVIAILVAHSDTDVLILDELTVSCRALGRNLENIMLPYLFKIASEKLHTKNVVQIEYKRGPRNAPALNWLSKITESELLSDKGIVKYIIPGNIETEGIEIEVK